MLSRYVTHKAKQGHLLSLISLKKGEGGQRGKANHEVKNNHNVLKAECGFTIAGCLINSDRSKARMRQEITGGTKQTTLLRFSTCLQFFF